MAMDEGWVAGVLTELLHEGTHVLVTRGGSSVVYEVAASSRKCYARADGESIMGEYAFMVDDDVAIEESANDEVERVEVIEYAMVELRRYFVGPEPAEDDDEVD